MAPHIGEPERNTFGFRFGMPQLGSWEIEPLEEAVTSIRRSIDLIGPSAPAVADPMRQPYCDMPDPTPN